MISKRREIWHEVENKIFKQVKKDHASNDIVDLVWDQVILGQVEIRRRQLIFLLATRESWEN